MLQTTKPRRARKSENPDAVHWYNDEVRLDLVDRYCMRDVEMERQLYNQLYLLSPEEFELWLLDQKINNRGFHIDFELAKAANKIVGEAYVHLEAELIKLTNGQVKTVNQVQEMRKWLYDETGLDVPDLDKSRVELLLSTVGDERQRRLLEIRQLGAHAAVKKIDAFLMRRGPDGRVRGEFQFHAAGTGRWSSRGVQVHNLKRIPDDFDSEAVIKVIREGDYKLANKTYPNPLKVIGTLMRPLIVAAPGHELWGADFSGIEARITAWLAGEKSKLNVFRAYDAGKGPDPYIVTAAIIFKCSPEKVTKDQRQVGKAAELAFGFQGGLGAFRKFSPNLNVDNPEWKGPFGKNWERDGDKFRNVAKQTEGFSDEEIENIKQAWRRAHPKICALWYNLNDAFWDAAHNPNQLQIIRPSGIEIVFNKTDFCLPVIWMTLPSGRQLVYPDIQVRSAEYREKDVSGRGVYFMDNTQGKWWAVRVYGGFLCENIVQAVARDLLAKALLQLDRAGFKIVTHTHDEVCVEEPKGSKRFKQFTEIMNAVPDWAKGLPVMAKGWQSDRYTK